jgi:hypothetical protein
VVSLAVLRELIEFVTVEFEAATLFPKLNLLPLYLMELHVLSLLAHILLYLPKELITQLLTQCSRLIQCLLELIILSLVLSYQLPALLVSVVRRYVDAQPKVGGLLIEVRQRNWVNHGVILEWSSQSEVDDWVDVLDGWLHYLIE